MVPSFKLALFSHESCLIDAPTRRLLCLQSFILCMQRVRRGGGGETGRGGGAGMEFCSIYPPEIFRSVRHTLFSLNPHCLFLTPVHPTSHPCVTCGHFTSFQDGLAGLSNIGPTFPLLPAQLLAAYGALFLSLSYDTS